MKKIGTLTILLFSLLHLFAQTRQIKGKVTNRTTGAVLPDVSVMLKGSASGVRTDTDGNFSIAVPDAGNVDLVFSLIGYGTQTITTTGNESVSVGLLQKSTDLDEVVVIG